MRRGARPAAEAPHQKVLDLEFKPVAGSTPSIGTQAEDFADTAAAIRLLDLVVMTDSAVAHLAASLGTPVWNLLPKVPYWLYRMAGETTPWYPAMRLIRQQRHGDWDGVFDRVAHDLRALAAGRVAR